MKDRKRGEREGGEERERKKKDKEAINCTACLSFK